MARGTFVACAYVTLKLHHCINWKVHHFKVAWPYVWTYQNIGGSKEDDHIEPEAENIIAYYRDKKSQRIIAREIGLNRRTVARYIKDYEKKRAELMATANDSQKEELTADIIETPGYDTRSRKKVKLTEEMMDRIQFYLQENEQKKKEGKYKKD